MRLKNFLLIITFFSSVLNAMQSGPKPIATFIYDFFASNKTFTAQDLTAWNKYIASIQDEVKKASNETVTQQFNKLLRINDAIINTMKFMQNTKNQPEKKEILIAFFKKNELFDNKKPLDALNAMQDNLKPGITSGKSITARKRSIELAGELKGIIKLMNQISTGK